MYNGTIWDTVLCEPSRTHLFPERIGGVPPTVLVVLLAAAIRNHLLFEGLVPVGGRDDAAALPLRNKHTRTTHSFVQGFVFGLWGVLTKYNVTSILMSPFAFKRHSDNRDKCTSKAFPL